MTKEQELNLKKDRKKFDIRKEYFVCETIVVAILSVLTHLS